MLLKRGNCYKPKCKMLLQVDISGMCRTEADILQSLDEQFFLKAGEVLSEVPHSPVQYFLKATCVFLRTEGM